jgi:23S rRNA (guanosine2251-2'-O)-methyltransferase
MSPSKAKDLLYGRNPVLETLRANRRQFQSLFLQENLDPSSVVKEILERAGKLSIPIEQTSRQDLDLRVKNHQGVLLQAGPYPYVELNEILEWVQTRSEPTLLLLLDQLKDPQNFGTLLRTAEAVGVHGVLLPARHAVNVTPAVVSVSSGASEHLSIAKVNLAQAMRKLKDQDVWLVGLERSETSLRIDQVDLRGPIGLVVGSEGDGLRPLVRKSCDFLVNLPMRGQVESLNAAVAGSLALYRIWEQQGY